MTDEDAYNNIGNFVYWKTPNRNYRVLIIQVVYCSIFKNRVIIEFVNPPCIFVDNTNTSLRTIAVASNNLHFTDR